MSSKQEKKLGLPITSNTISFLPNYSHTSDKMWAMHLSHSQQYWTMISASPEKGYTVILTIAVNYSTAGHPLSGCFFQTREKAITIIINTEEQGKWQK